MSEPTILIVDDEPSIREVVSIYLGRAGYRVLVAEDGQTALGDDHHFHLIEVVAVRRELPEDGPVG